MTEPSVPPELPLPKDFRCGMVSIVGRPNVGKSTLLNHIVGEKVSIVSQVPQTTRNRVRGIYNSDRCQIVFIDTPGLVMGRDRLDEVLKQASLGSIHDVDCVIHLADSSEPVGREEEMLVQRLKDLPCPVMMGLNKVDLGGKFIPDYIQLWEKVRGKPVTEFERFTMVGISGSKGINIDKFIELLTEQLPQGEPLYPRDTVSDVPQKMMVADIIREKLFWTLRQELPHSVAVFIEQMQRRKNAMIVKALIMVEKDSQKMIVIGKDGNVLKKVGTMAREELETLLEEKVFLELYVKSQKNWRDDAGVLQDLGYEQT